MLNDIIDNLTWLNLLILTMGAYSITRFVLTDSLLEEAREWLYHRFPHEGYASTTKPKRGDIRRTSNNVYVVDQGTKIGDLFSCPWCFGFWVSLGITIAFAFIPEITIVGLLPFAMRALVGGYANKIGGG